MPEEAQNNSHPEASKPLSANGFDRTAARMAAAQEVEKAVRVAEAVESFHEASERTEAAQAVVAENSEVRRRSVRVMRESGYSAARISELTGVSPSTIQKILSPSKG